jgi:hypothetical protein
LDTMTGIGVGIYPKSTPVVTLQHLGRHVDATLSIPLDHRIVKHPPCSLSRHPWLLNRQKHITLNLDISQHLSNSSNTHTSSTPLISLRSHLPPQNSIQLQTQFRIRQINPHTLPTASTKANHMPCARVAQTRTGAPCSFASIQDSPPPLGKMQVGPWHVCWWGGVVPGH